MILQIVKKPTRKNAILDLVLTNLHQFYDEPCTFPPFGLSDHHTVTVAPRIRDKSQSASKFVLKRDKRASRKAELGRYLDAIDWLTLFSSAESCEDLLDVFMNCIRTGLDLIMPVKRVRINTTDAPWMTQHLKSLIRKRQKAFHQHGSDSVQFKFFRNAVNRGRKACKASFYKSKVENMKEENPGVWWREVKRLAGVQSSPGNVISQIQVEGVENISEKEFADLINWAFLEPLEEYRLHLPLSKLPVEEDSLFLEVSEARMQSLLANLNPSKASGPDSIPNWLLKEYADFLCRPLTVIFNASFKEQCLPQIWKMADVTPLPKTKPVKELKKDLRPISLTACLSKVAEECVVVDYVKPAALRVLDPNHVALLFMIQLLPSARAASVSCKNNSRKSEKSKNCAELYTRGQTTSGVYTIDPDGKGAFDVYCDQTSTGGGWTVIQKRQNGPVDFNHTWDDYTKGFGNFLIGGFWLGLNKINPLTQNETENKLRLYLVASNKAVYAEYASFGIGDRNSNYTLSLGNFSSKSIWLVKS
ncbi:Angiopoietin-related protein 3 [Stylophora pistillata]|uniref:Angiopoietin-related protein 3 n=1 Tax=Stylophora pistillata TaxID=50429 RepID=A0A2B4RMH3_STYPI|nr:Angiopoietin-related protein 3 [Stylophora pistillata]